MIADKQAGEIAERGLLSSILQGPSVFPDVAEVVTESSFAFSIHRDIFEAMRTVQKGGGSPDFVNTYDVLNERHPDEMWGTILTEIMGVEYTDAYALEYAHRVQHHAARRHVLDVLQQAFVEVHADTDADPVERAHEALARINDVMTDAGGPVLYADRVEAFQERLTDQLAGIWVDPVLPTGIHSLDMAITGGFRAAELIVLAARAGAGKTAMALQIMHNMARRKEPVLLFSAEMSVESLIERAVAEISGVNASELRKKSIDQSVYDRLMRATEMMGRMPVAIDDTSAIQTKTMLNRAMRFKRKYGLSAIFFDYMELAGDTTREGESVRVGKISHAMKAMAKQLNVPVVALSQLNRDVEDRDPPMPRMSDIKWSGAIEQDADKILFLYRQDYYQAQGFKMTYLDEKVGVTDIIIGKQRNGETGVVSVRFDGPTMRFTDLDAHPSEAYATRSFA